MPLPRCCSSTDGDLLQRLSQVASRWTTRRKWGGAALDNWLDEHEYASVAEMCGSMSYNAVPDPTAYERGNYMKVLGSYTL